MASLLSSNPYDKQSHSVELIHDKEDGVVHFVSAADSDISKLNLKLKSSSNADSTSGEFIKKTLLKWKVAVFLEILWCGLKKDGAICLVGWTLKTNPEPQKLECFPAIRTVIQLDGDIICQVSRDLLNNKNTLRFLELYQKVISEFLSQFTMALDKRVKLIRRLIVSTLVAGGLTILYL